MFRQLKGIKQIQENQPRENRTMAAKKTTKKAPAKEKDAKKAPAKKKAASKKVPAKKAPAKKKDAKKAPAKKKAAARKAKKVQYTDEQVYSMIEQAAYFSAENDGFSKEPAAYWSQAEAAVNSMIKG